MKNRTLLFTCEHASNAIPNQYNSLFHNKKKILKSHRGFDNGSQELGEKLSHQLKCPVVLGSFSRLLVDLNRGPKHPKAFSEWTISLSKIEKETIIKKYHRPHWDEVENKLKLQWEKNKQIIHVGIHSFTPILNTDIRNADIGILYDPKRKSERELALFWQKILQQQSSLRVRLNYPYLGKLDGLTTQLRKKYSEQSYLGLEIEINQNLLKNKNAWLEIQKILVTILRLSL